jgi:hypothetical protein
MPRQSRRTGTHFTTAPRAGRNLPAPELGRYSPSPEMGMSQPAPEAGRSHSAPQMGRIKVPSRARGFVPCPRTLDRMGAYLMQSTARRGSVSALRRAITVCVAVVGATVVFASSAAASVPPVNYSDTITGPGGAVNGVVSCSYGGLTSTPPVNVYSYPGTANIYWTSRPETWNGSSWGVLTTTETFKETGYYKELLANGWIFFYGTRGWSNTATSTFTTAPASWNASHGYYYATKDVTYWYNSAGRLLDSYVNYTNYCEA